MSPHPAGRPAVFQVLASAAPFDAVTGQALALQDELRLTGIASAIAAEHIEPSLAERVLPLHAVTAGTPVLLRYSIWSAAAEQALSGTGPVGVVFHNITPAHFLARWNPEVAALCQRGRERLPLVASRAQMLVADSEFNARELRGAGDRAVRVIPLILDLPPITQHTSVGSDHVLYVGRLAPNKRVEDCISAAVLLQRTRPASQLHIVGSGDAFPMYAAALRQHARANGATDYVHFHGSVDDAVRDSLYAQAGAYLTLSEHEGFCAPVVEAMARGLPVVARDAGAVRETAGGGALLIPERDPELTAAALDAAIADATVRQGLAANARVRLRQLEQSSVAAQMVDAVRDLLS